MNLLIVNASPRHHGNIDKMLQIIYDEAQKQGAQTRFLRTDSLQAEPCKGCMACRKSLKCVLPDDGAQQFLADIQWCDRIVIGAPCYWGNMPGHLKMLFDRIVYGMMGENEWGIPIPLHKGKKALIVSTCTTLWPLNLWFNQTKGAVKALHEILKYSGFKLIGTIQKAGTHRHKGLTARNIRQCRKKTRCLLR